MSKDHYQWLLDTHTRKQWEVIGTKRRAGVVAPLFSVYSKRSIGIGEIPDLKLLVDWCRLTHMSILQLLPLNDTGYNFTPYDAQSTFAFDPIYLSLEELAGVELAAQKDDMNRLRKQFPAGQSRVDYKIKGAKLGVLWKIFRSRDWRNVPAFKAFQQENKFWLGDYAAFRVIKSLQDERAWWDWPEEYRTKNQASLGNLRQEHADQILFQEWLQWQLKEQFHQLKIYAREKGVFILGDLPFLVSRDSADVWSNQHYFKLDCSAGAPPDMFFAKGQRWGMPTYDWGAIAAHDFDYLKEKLKYASLFYDLYRIDHFVGIFRVWTIPLSEPEESGGLNGTFDPKDEAVWEAHGRRLLDVMLAATPMLPCAEDLGTVPDCSYTTIRDYGLVGTDVQRWVRDWKHSLNFKDPSEYRPNGIAAISTHDLSNMKAWWTYEIGTIDELLFRRKCESHHLDADWLIRQLFDPEGSKYGRLRWRRDVDSVDVLLSIVFRPREEVGDIVGMFMESRDEKRKFLAMLGIEGDDRAFTPDFAQEMLKSANRAASIFSIQLLIDWLWVGNTLEGVDAWNFRINCPGSMCATNWSLVMPFSLEQLLQDPANPVLGTLNQKTGRC